MTISTYRDERNASTQHRIVLDISRAQVWAYTLAALAAFFTSAAAGVMATAHQVVPPIAQATLKPDLDRLVAADARLDAAIAKVERDDAVRAADNTRALREQMSELQQQLRETSRVTNELLLQLVNGRGR
jgi:uncharacterized lipoprotein YajG